MPPVGFEPTSRRAAEDLRLRPRPHWDRHFCELRTKKKLYKELVVSHYEVQSLHLPEIAVVRAEMFKLHRAVKF
jgi:hypothetical protein